MVGRLANGGPMVTLLTGKETVVERCGDRGKCPRMG